MTNPALARLETLKGFLDADPDNPALLNDVGRTALEADDCEVALRCFEALEQIEQLDSETANLAGISAMRCNRQVQAQKWFSDALEEIPDDHGAKFNLAWSLALDGDLNSSAELLDEDITSTLPQAALLDMQVAHELGHFDEAGAKMDAYLAKHPDYGPLQAAASVLAMDVDRPDLARDAAIKGGEHPDALTTLGSLNLGDSQLEEAEAQFTRALATGKKNPRAEIGIGLVALSRGDHGSAARAIDAGAEQFGDHLGSWIAAGWAHFLAGDVDTARQRFQTAIDIDDTFGEAHGSLAVIHINDGEMTEAKRKAEVAGRLDPSSFSSALAKILLASADDQPERAKELLDRAMSTSILPDGKTLEQAIVQSMTGAKAGRNPTH